MKVGGFLRALLALWVAICPLEASKEEVKKGGEKERTEPTEKEKRSDGEPLTAKKAKEAEPEEKSPIFRAGDQGFSLASRDGAFELRWRGYIQVDSRWFFEGREKSGVNGFLMRRVRPIWEGTLYKEFDFRLMVDFGGTAVTLQDGYLGWNHWPQCRLRIGQFKAPVGLERLQSATDLAFNERAFPTQLLPNRDIGFQVDGKLAGEQLYYAVALLNGVVDHGSTIGSNGTNEVDLAARLFVQPFRCARWSAWRGVGVGVAATLGRERGTATRPLLPVYLTPAQQLLFSYRIGSPADGDNTVIADGKRQRLTPQSYYHYGPFGLMSEYALSGNQVAIGESRATLWNHAWQVTSSWVISGEEASYTGVKPRHPFDLQASHWGAWEWVMRYHELYIDPKAFPRFADPETSASQAKSWSLGLNWYLNNQIKVAASYSQARFRCGAANGANRSDEKLLFTRAQVSF